MHRHLYFVCPTDHLESVINNTFKQENYFITSHGNSIEFDKKVVSEINELLDSKKITNISFALSQSNRVVLEAMEKKCAEIAELSAFQNKLHRQQKFIQEVWQTNDPSFLAFSCHLNGKIKELKRELYHLRTDIPKIDGIIYDKFEGRFKSSFSNLMHENNVSVN